MGNQPSSSSGRRKLRKTLAGAGGAKGNPIPPLPLEDFIAFIELNELSEEVIDYGIKYA